MQQCLVLAALIPAFCLSAEVSTPSDYYNLNNLMSIQSSSANLIRSKRYILRSKRWKKRHFTWKLLPHNLQPGDDYIIRNVLHRSFGLFSAVSSLTFEELEPEIETDFVIAFERKQHDDDFPFDGRDGVVAHAFYPRDGRLHFDADEYWTLNSKKGVNLFQTCVHEIGHLLGLEHSTDPRAAMFGARRPFDPEFTLGDDDVRAIRALFPSKDANNKEDEEFAKESKDEEPRIIENLEASRRRAILIDSSAEDEHRKLKDSHVNLFPYPLISHVIKTSSKYRDVV